MLAEELRVAASELKRLSGNFGAEDVLDVVFAEFCVGK
jgi:tRNA modification GTPase